MSANIGTIDRIVRALIGLALLWLAFLSGLPVMASPAAQYIAAAVGVIMLATSAIRFCPLYRLFGFRTCTTC
ncbi:MAG: DUF2892 domain-containing protein [Alphaproteobacteria bacterium]|nr:MAG: DUF2892 domain-containing protein [Alphaproteobacteria bacterium]